MDFSSTSVSRFVIWDEAYKAALSVEDAAALSELLQNLWASSSSIVSHQP